MYFLPHHRTVLKYLHLQNYMVHSKATHITHNQYWTLDVGTKKGEGKSRTRDRSPKNWIVFTVWCNLLEPSGSCFWYIGLWRRPSLKKCNGAKGTAVLILPCCRNCIDNLPDSECSSWFPTCRLSDIFWVWQRVGAEGALTGCSQSWRWGMHW